MNFDYQIESRPLVENNEFQLTITDDIKDFSSVTYITDWTVDRFEMYHDAIQFLNSLIKSAEGLKERIMRDIKEIVDEMA